MSVEMPKFGQIYRIVSQTPYVSDHTYASSLIQNAWAKQGIDSEYLYLPELSGERKSNFLLTGPELEEYRKVSVMGRANQLESEWAKAKGIGERIRTLVKIVPFLAEMAIKQVVKSEKRTEDRNNREDAAIAAIVSEKSAVDVFFKDGKFNAPEMTDELAKGLPQD